MCTAIIMIHPVLVLRQTSIPPLSPLDMPTDLLPLPYFDLHIWWASLPLSTHAVIAVHAMCSKCNCGWPVASLLRRFMTRCSPKFCEPGCMYFICTAFCYQGRLHSKESSIISNRYFRWPDVASNVMMLCSGSFPSWPITQPTTDHRNCIRVTYGLVLS